MKIGAYSPRTGNLLSNDITGINFGNVYQGKHSVLPVLIRPRKESENISGLEMYLQNKGGFQFTNYGFFTSSNFVQVYSYDQAYTGLTGVNFISDHFIENTGATGSTGAVHLNLKYNSSDGNYYGDYVWLDVQPSLSETGGTDSINYRFTFEYS